MPCRSGTFASGGSDGIVSIWDYKLKKRLRQYAKFHAAVTSVSFNSNGTKMAVGVGYLHENGHGEKGSKSSIIIKTIDDAKVCLLVEVVYHKGLTMRRANQSEMCI